MNAYLLASVFFAALASAGLGGLYVVWPRRMTAEEWVLRRRAAVAGSVASGTLQGVGARRRSLGLGRQLARFELGLAVLRADLNLLHLENQSAPASEDDLVSSLIRLGMLGAAGGFVAGLVEWIVPGRQGLPWIVLLLTVGCGVLLPALTWIRLRRRAEQLRGRIRRQLPRLLTGSRMLLESGAGTPQQALTQAVSVYSDPAADVLREALRMKEVQRIELEAALDRVGQEFGLEPLHRLADSFRVGTRFGTQMSNLLTDFALRLRQGWHAEYRERINRAPVLMTVPAMVFFVLPLLALILLLVFTPLVKTLTEL